VKAITYAAIAITGGENTVKPIFEGRRLYKHFAGKKGHPPVRACENVYISIGEGVIVGLVGESGCGKTTVGRLLLRLTEADRGLVYYRGKNLTRLHEKEIRPLRKNFQMIFQDSRSAFNPRMRVIDALKESIRLYHEDLKLREVRERVYELSDLVNLSRGMLHSFVGNLSGGELKRLDIARTISIGPDFIIADEPLTLLDLSIQSQMADLLMTYQEQRNAAILFISHDLRMVEMLSRTVLVMFGGRIIEQASKRNVTTAPLHPYTKHLWDPRSTVSFAQYPESGCVYLNNCLLHQMKGYPNICIEEAPELIEYSDHHFAACHFAGQM
jgi:ABC-type oligopeptide transport system ATPase subunit